jgi:integral membrane protein
MNEAIHALRRTGIVEAISFCVLLFIAMPLKHSAGFPLAVKIAGWLHGIFFVAYCIVLYRAQKVCRWPLSRSALLFGSAVIPFGPFYMDRRLRQYAAEAENA